MKRGLATFAAAIACAALTAGNAASKEPPKSAEQSRTQVRAMANETLASLYAAQPGAKSAVARAAGYAVFSNIGMKILVAGGGKGQGLAMDRNHHETFMRMVEVQAGIGFGAKKFRQVWIFESDAAFRNFVDKGFQFGGQATLAAKAGGQGAGVAGAMSVSPGVWLYQITDTGLAAELTAKGTKYYWDEELN